MPIQTFLVSDCSDKAIGWLESTLGDQARLVTVASQLEAILGLVDQMGVSIVFVGISRQTFNETLSVIEGLSESRPLVAVVALSESDDSELVLGAMRAGAKDFLTIGQRGSDVQSLVRRLGRRQPTPGEAPQGQRARVVTLYGVDGAEGATFAACHLGLALASKAEPVLLLDVAPKLGEVEALLNIKCTFGVEDAMRAAQRLDSAVISSAFTKHSSGLYVLPLVQDERYPEAYSYAEAILLLGVLRPHFSTILINACGQADSGCLRALVSASDQLLWYLTQSVPGSRRSLLRLQRWRADAVTLNDVGLLVDDYRKRLAPEPSVMANLFGLPVVATLPGHQEQRLNALNQGIPLYELAPKDELGRALKALAKALTPEARAAKRSRGLFARWRR